MCGDVFSAIKSQYNVLTRVERSIADYILAHGEEVVYMSIIQLAEKCNVGESSVFRFCCHIGCNGYQEFRMKLALAVRAAEQKTILDGYAEKVAGTIAGQIHQVYLDSVAALRETYQMLNARQLEAAAGRLRHAGRILFIGVGGSLISVIAAYQTFLRVTPKACWSMDARTQQLLASMLVADDAAVIFSHSGTTKDTLCMAETAKRNGAYLIGITRFAHSPLASLCDQCFLCGGSNGPAPLKRMVTLSVHSFLMDSLCSAFDQRSESVQDDPPLFASLNSDDLASESLACY